MPKKIHSHKRGSRSRKYAREVVMGKVFAAITTLYRPIQWRKSQSKSLPGKPDIRCFSDNQKNKSHEKGR